MTSLPGDGDAETARAPAGVSNAARDRTKNAAIAAGQRLIDDSSSNVARPRVGGHPLGDSKSLRTVFFVPRIGAPPAGLDRRAARGEKRWGGPIPASRPPDSLIALMTRSSFSHSLEQMLLTSSGSATMTKIVCFGLIEMYASWK